jgi:hypothetical protein
MSKLPANEAAEVVCKKCCHFIEALVQRCPEGGLCEAVSRLPAVSEDEIVSEPIDAAKTVYELRELLIEVMTNVGALSLVRNPRGIEIRKRVNSTLTRTEGIGAK